MCNGNYLVCVILISAANLFSSQISGIMHKEMSEINFEVRI